MTRSWLNTTTTATRRSLLLCIAMITGFASLGGTTTTTAFVVVRNPVISPSHCPSSAVAVGMAGTGTGTDTNSDDDGDDVATSNKDWFQQQAGERDIAFIKRITSSTPPPPKPAKTSAVTNGKGYQRIEEWDADRKTQMTWEERVQFEGQQYGNQGRQNDILMRQINSGM